jgi:hypothetical protein
MSKPLTPEEVDRYRLIIEGRKGHIENRDWADRDIAALLATLDAARLSHDRGADAEERSLALSALGEAVRDAAMLRHENVTIQAPLARYLMALLSVPAPTLPALDAARDRLLDAISGERQHWHRVEVDPRDIDATLRYLSRLMAAARVGDWHDSIGSGPIEELNAELGELREALRDAV